MEKFMESLPEKVKKNEILYYLQEFQDMFGYIDLSLIELLSQKSDIPSGKIYGVASFYNQFRFKPKGRIHVQVCEGSSCHLNNGLAIIEELKKLTKTDEKEISSDGKYSFEIIPCMGACSQGPVVAINGKFFTKVKVTELKSILLQEDDNT